MGMRFSPRRGSGWPWSPPGLPQSTTVMYPTIGGVPLPDVTLHSYNENDILSMGAPVVCRVHNVEAVLGVLLG